MKQSGWQWLVISSLLVGNLAAQGRPRYGGALRVTMHAAVTSVDPANGTERDSATRQSLTFLMFDSLIGRDDSGRLRPGLATSWESSAGHQRWQIHLRQGIRFHDGTLLNAEVAASSLRAANPDWNVSVAGDAMVIERSTADPELPAELSLAHNAIVKKMADGRLVGTGPFQVVDWQTGKALSLAAHEDCWRGRPYLDRIEIEFGKSLRDQRTALDIGKADLIEVAPEQSRRAAVDAGRTPESAPIELVALVFSRDAQSGEEKLLRDALALSIERASMQGVLLQGAGQASGGILPTWMNGYGFVFPVDADLAQARRLRGQVPMVPTWAIGYDTADPLARLLAERVALNAKDAGLFLQPSTARQTDLHLVRISLAASDPWLALAGVAAATGLETLKTLGGPLDDLYATEKSMLATRRLIPLFHLPATYATAASVRNATVRADGALDLADVWRASDQP